MDRSECLHTEAYKTKTRGPEPNLIGLMCHDCNTFIALNDRKNIPEELQMLSDENLVELMFREISAICKTTIDDVCTKYPDLFKKS